MSTFSYLLLLGNLFFRVGIILAISKKAGDRLPSAPLEMKPMVSPTDLSPKLHWPSGPQGHNVCSQASWKHTRSAEFSLYIFTISLSWLEESTKFISKKKERTVSTRSVVIRGYFAICTPATQEGNAKIHFAPIKLEAVLLKETLVWWRWNEKLIKIIMFGSMRLSAWKHKRDPASRGGNYPQTFHFLGGGLEKHIAPPSTQPTPFQRREGRRTFEIRHLWICELACFCTAWVPSSKLCFRRAAVGTREHGCGRRSASPSALGDNAILPPVQVRCAEFGDGTLAFVPWTPTTVGVVGGKTQLQIFSPFIPRAAGAGGKEPVCQSKRHKRCGFEPWVGKIPWKRKWQLTPVFLPGESHGQRSLVGLHTVHRGRRVRHDWATHTHI